MLQLEGVARRTGTHDSVKAEKREFCSEETRTRNPHGRLRDTIFTSKAPYQMVVPGTSGASSSSSSGTGRSFFWAPPGSACLRFLPGEPPKMPWSTV